MIARYLMVKSRMPIITRLMPEFSIKLGHFHKDNNTIEAVPRCLQNTLRNGMCALGICFSIRRQTGKLTPIHRTVTIITHQFFRIVAAANWLASRNIAMRNAFIGKYCTKFKQMRSYYSN